MSRTRWNQPISRRTFLRLGLAGAAASLLSACGATASELPAPPPNAADATFLPPPTLAATSTPSPTPTPPPFTVPAGEQRVALMGGTAFETPLHIFGSGLPGPVLLVLGGVHGNEPGGWLAAEELLATLRPAQGAVLVVPQANRLAAASFIRTRDDWGDLNRLYPGTPDGLPMAQLAHQIMETVREYQVSVVLDMHESWAFFNGRPQNGTAYLGQTVATSPDERAKSLAHDAVAAVNTRIRHPREQLFDRNDPNSPPAQNGSPPSAGGGGRPGGSGIPNAGRSVPGFTSSLGLSRFVAGVSTLLVEMGQQQELDRRIALHVDLATEVATRMGITAGQRNA